MKITHVEVWTVPVAAPSPSFKWRAGLPGSGAAGERGILRIGTDTGATGVAFASRPGSASMLRDLVDRVWRDELVGQDPLQREHLYHRIWELDRLEEFALPYLGTVDLALWDLAAREAGLPLWQFLGVRGRGSPRTPRPRRSTRRRSSSPLQIAHSSRATRRSSCTRGATRVETQRCARRFATMSAPTFR